MANDFGKQDLVDFEKVVEGFEDQLVLSNTVTINNTNMTDMERSGNMTYWRPEAQIITSFAGIDQTANFQNVSELMVPASININRSVPVVLKKGELNDANRLKRITESARQRLASDINQSILNLAAYYGNLVVARSGAAAGFADIAAADAIMSERGISTFDRKIALSTRNYNLIAADKSATPNLVRTESNKAYDKAYVGEIAGFDTFKLDTGIRLAAAAGGAGITIDTRDVGAQYYTPVATSTAVTGEVSNVDNRQQLVTVSDTTSVAAGDCFTIAGVNSVHMITKGDTGQLMTFRVISVQSGTTMVISPPLVTGQGGTFSETQYQNCVVNTKSATSAISFTNIAAAEVNPFWHKSAIELLPGRYNMPTNAGIAIMKGTTSQGLEITMQKQADIDGQDLKYRLDIFYGVAMLQPQMCGIMLFNQT